MIEATTEITAFLAQELDAYLSETESPWILFEDLLEKTFTLKGFFETQEEVLEAYRLLRKSFGQLPDNIPVSAVENRNWKEAYKEHFKPWHSGDLHWVPTWGKKTYAIPDGEKAIYLDPGMAFGTGNHETTRLCALRLLEAYKMWQSDLAKKSIIDAGCGSGILAISGAALGFGSIYGFDIDPDSVIIAQRNLEENNLTGKAHFDCLDIVKGIGDRQADLVLANVLANILCEHASWLIGAVAPKGILVLSGILAEEINDVRRCFFAIADKAWEAFKIDTRVDGQWADLCLIRE